MELVYLWVEKYKNIYKQGFNFSPRFECTFYDTYDENNQLLDNCELKIKPKEYIENFFGDNINVTAIVGKNGSGKSSIAEMILPEIPHKKHKKYIIVAFDFEKNEFKSYGNIQVDISTLDTELSFSVVEIGANKNRDYNHNITIALKS
ncbi:MAG: hypothetical protein IE909_18690, partial [Campylobacterales bacterium]|nr:hypothetical protein [Campylobacterales bacterium]